MSIIQRIREKGALISAIVIALALLGFIAMDAFSGRSSLTGGQSSTVGRVNGEKIDIDNFRQLVALTEQNRISQGAPSGEGTTQQAIESVWNQEVNRILEEQELEKLGLKLSKKEMSDLLYGPNPSAAAKQVMGGQEGTYNPEQLRQAIRQIERSGRAEQKADLIQRLKYIEQTRLDEKFRSLFSNSTNSPKWKFEKQNADNSQVASISFVRKPYTDIPDSIIKISDNEIRDYISKNKDRFKQEESRSISYVTFNAAPSAADTAEARNAVAAQAGKFLETKDEELFLAREGTDFPYAGNFVLAEQMQLATKDSILKTAVGNIFGPYLDNTHYVVAKMVETKQVPDSVTVRHILIATAQQDPQSGQFIPVMDTSVARIRIDSIKNAIQGGAIFDSLCAKYSADGNKDSGGIYKNVHWGRMVPEFNDFIFTKGQGAKGVVYTEFGFHYIEILQNFGSGKRAVKVAFLAKPILVSSKTDADASSAASQFAGDSPNEKAFNETFEKQLKPKGHNKGIAYDILPNGYNIMGLGVSRDFVRKIYAAKRGEVLQPEKVGSNYVVAVVTEINEKGTRPVAKARPEVEAALRNKKKAEIIKKQIGTISTLEAAATAMGGKQVENADSLRISSGGAELGYEPKVLGAAFNAANRGKVVPEAIEGQAGVYVVRVNDVTATPLADANVAEQRKAEMERAKQQAMYSSPLQVLREAATIKDNRSKHY